MLGWLADSFRFAWALLYWNTRKSWFRIRRGRSACPCQSPSDSGRAYETSCDACVHWERRERFRRVCPLLVATKDGLRCSANTEDVRPFWGIAFRYYGGTALAVYAAAVLAVFGFLRTIGYPVSIVHVALPPMWHRVGQARGWFFLSRAERAFAAGRTNEGLLYLANAYEFDPRNYEAGLALAKSFQAGEAARSDAIFAQLMQEHPSRRAETAQHWFRALLARGDFKEVAQLASREMIEDPSHAQAWLRGLLQATRQSADAAPLEALRRNPSPAAQVWRPLLETELLVRAGRTRDALARVQAPWADDAPAFTIIYRVETLAALRQPVAALDLLEQQRARIDDEAWLTLRLGCLADAGAKPMLRSEFSAYLLGPTLTQPRLKVICAQLIRHPDIELFEQVCAKVAREKMPLSDETAGGWFSLLCTAGAVGDQVQLHTLALRLRQASDTPFAALSMVESFFRPDNTDRRPTSFLPFLPVPLEITYALFERFPATGAVRVVATP